MNSSGLGSLSSACARRVARSAAARVCLGSSSLAVSAAVAHAHASILHDACSDPAEDLRPISEVEAGINFRPACGVRGQVAGSLPGRQPGTCTRRVREGAVTPSLHLEVPDTQFVSPGRGLGIRQSMGWTNVCSTARSGIWVLQGAASARFLPDNLDHLRVEWRKQGTYETARVTPGHGCLCPHKYGHRAAASSQTINAIAPFLSPWFVVSRMSHNSCLHGVQEWNMPTEVNSEPVRQCKIMDPLAQRSRALFRPTVFGPPNQPKLIVSMSIRPLGGVPGSSRIE